MSNYPDDFNQGRFDATIGSREDDREITRADVERLTRIADENPLLKPLPNRAMEGFNAGREARKAIGEVEVCNED